MTEVAFLVILCVIVAANATDSSSAALPRLLTPTLHAQELFHRADNTWWSIEMKAASQEVDRRREQRKLRQRETQSSKNNCLSPLQRWFVSLIDAVGMDTWEELNYYNVTSLAYLYKHYVSSSSGQNEYFGTHGENTKHMSENHDSLKQFWALGNNGISSNVILLGMHGNDLSETSNLVPTLQQHYRLDAPAALTLSGKIQSIIQKLPDGYNNHLLTANALAVQSPSSDGFNSERDSVIVGDGVFAFLEWLQLDNGPDYIHSHEFSHHLQYDLGIMEKGMGLSQAEETRRLELMSDMFASYYLGHSQGGRMNTNQLNEVHRSAFSMGDCESAIATHHGSPRQRECASNFGANLAIKFGGGVLPPIKLMDMFDSKLAEILALTADECKNGLDESILDSTFYGHQYSDNSAVVASLGESSSASGNGSTGYWWDKTPLEDIEELNIPTWGVPPPSTDIDYTSWSTSSESGYNPWGYDSGSNVGTTNGWDSPEEGGSSSAHDMPPEKVHNDDFYSSGYEKDYGNGWFGNGSQWIVGATNTNSGSSKKIDVFLGAGLLSLVGLMV